jgi:hypothetical protein
MYLCNILKRQPCLTISFVVQCIGYFWNFCSVKQFVICKLIWHLQARLHCDFFPIWIFANCPSVLTLVFLYFQGFCSQVILKIPVVCIVLVSAKWLQLWQRTKHAYATFWILFGSQTLAVPVFCRHRITFIPSRTEVDRRLSCGQTVAGLSP